MSRAKSHLHPLGRAILGLGLLIIAAAPACSPTPHRTPSIVLDGESAAGVIRLFWSTSYPPSPDGFGSRRDPPTSVLLSISETGPANGYRFLARRPGGIVDSLQVPDLVDGRPYWFRATLLGGSHLPTATTAPISLMPGVSPPLLQFDLDESAQSREGLAWSPDGAELAFVHYLDSTDPQLRVVDLATSAERVVFADPGIEFMGDPVWSSDGTRIAFTASPSRTSGDIDYRIWLVDRAGTSPRSLSPGRVDFSPGWVPGDSALVFCRGTYDAPNIAEIHRLELATSGTVSPLTRDQSMHKRYPDVRSTDGLLVFQGTPRSSYRAGLYVVPLAGGAIRPLVTSDWWNEYLPRWSPNGTKVAFNSNRSGHEDIWVLDVARGGFRQVTTGRLLGAYDRQAAWSPDGSRIAVMEQSPWGRWRVSVFAVP